MKPLPLRMPGATLVTRLKVYDTESPDGQRGGTPHFHLACTEMYFVLSGSGAVEIIDSNGFQKIDLPTHSAFLFSAGSLHRLLNPNRDMEILIVMQNSGLPERGDTVATFPDEILSDDLRYHKMMRAGSLADALNRRDRSVDGFLALKAAFARSQAEGRTALERVYSLGRARTASHHKEWYDVIAKGAFAEAQENLHQVIDITAGKLGHLFEARNFFIPAQHSNTVGFCGTLNRYFDPATVLPEGVAVT